MPFEGGPYVQAACVCDMVLQDDTGTASLIRIIDTITHGEAGPNAPESMPPFVHKFWTVIMLKSGAAQGRSELRITPELPNGELREPIVLTVHFEGGERGHNIMMQTAFQFTLEGLHWFNIDLDGERLTRIPLRVRYERLVATTSAR